jgi:hypothetical protein
MKKLIYLLTVLLPVMAFSQGLNLPSVTLKTMDARNVKASELLQDNQSALIYFFNETSQDALDNLEYLQTLADKNDNCDQLRIFAVYNPIAGSYANLEPFLSGNCIELETYIDPNGALQRSLGLPVNSPVLLSDLGPAQTQRITGNEAGYGKLTTLVSYRDPSKDVSQSVQPCALAIDVNGPSK